jgi:hypothetical protein
VGLARAPEDIDSREGTAGMKFSSDLGDAYVQRPSGPMMAEVDRAADVIQRAEDGRPVTLEEFERAMRTARQAGEAMASMAEVVGAMADSFHAAAGQFRRSVAEMRMSGDAMRWRPEPAPDITPDTPVRHCPRMFREEEHPGHPDTDLSGMLVQCPGYPLPSILDLAPDCETGDVQTCTPFCPLHG